MTSRAKVVVFGEILYDRFFGSDPSQPLVTVLGGAPLNFAYHLQNNFGVPCALISALGRDTGDDLAGSAIGKLVQEGIATALIQRVSSKPTGLVHVWTTRGAHSFEILPDRAFDYISVSPAALEQAERSEYFYFGTLAQRSPESRVTLMTLLDAAKDAKKFCDINLRKDCYSAESVISSIERADVVKFNQDEVIEVVRMLSPAPLSDGTNPAEASRELFEIIKARKSAIELVVTLGAQGALAFDVAGTLYHHPGYHISPGRDADTVGSGDAFAAAYVRNRMSGASIDQALAEGNRAGALVACQRGALCKISATERLREQSRAHMPQSHHIERSRVIEP